MGRENGFTALRLFAAVLVLFTHGYVLGRSSPDPVMVLTGLLPASTFGVDMFFAISGFLICGSLRRQPDALHYLRNRFLRIFPALLVVCLLSVFVLGPWLTTAEHYWSEPGTFAYLLNATIYGWQPFLPGVFTQNGTAVVNGSLWTLPMETTCYLLLLLIGWCGALNWRGMSVIVLAAYLLNLFTVFPRGVTLFQYSGALELYYLNRFVILFAGGSLIQLIGRPWAVSAPVTLVAGLLVLAALLLGQHDWRYFPAIYLLAWPWFVISLAYRLKGLSGLDRFDISYGIYLYSFPMQQAIIQWMHGGAEPMVVNLMALAATVVLAGASWFLIERPALSLKGRAVTAKAAAPLAAPAGSVLRS